MSKLVTVDFKAIMHIKGKADNRSGIFTATYKGTLFEDDIQSPEFLKEILLQKRYDKIYIEKVENIEFKIY